MSFCAGQMAIIGDKHRFRLRFDGRLDHRMAALLNDKVAAVIQHRVGPSPLTMANSERAAATSISAIATAKACSAAA